MLGVANPSGKLAETIPVRLQDNSSYLNFPGEEGVVRYGEGIFIGYRAYDTLIQHVSYPFGFGLSYTSFHIDDVEVSVSGSVAGSDLTVTVTASVSNTRSAGGEPRLFRSTSGMCRRRWRDRSGSSKDSSRWISSRAKPSR